MDRRASVSLAVALLAGVGTCTSYAHAQPAAPAPAAQPTGDNPAQIDRNGVLILVRSTLLALDDANRTGNYTVLRDLGAPGFQAGNTAARLAEIFANLRAQNLDLSGVAVLDPQLTTLPTIGPNGQMRMAGFFPSVPLQINFELLYAPVEGRTASIRDTELTRDGGSSQLACSKGAHDDREDDGYGAGVRVGPWCQVGADVQLGEGCSLVCHVTVSGHMTVGARACISPFASLGGAPYQ